MYAYKYVTLIGEDIMRTRYREHREVIDRHAAEGWRYVGWVPAYINGNGRIEHSELIFEREM